jgi:dTDP-4-dehydrorhamnose 3,5-epimerase
VGHVVRARAAAAAPLLTFHPAGLPGCVVVDPRDAKDERGRFVKLMHAPSFAERGMACDFVETFYTASRRGVLRGMHLQLPPHAHAKLVSCLVGTVLDVLLDLRVGSPTYGEHRAFELCDDQPRALYVAPGVAHGFYTLSEEATMVYLVTSVHAPTHDAGVRWDTFGMQWPDAEPVLSPRDRMLPPLDEFVSPFAFGGVSPSTAG